MSIPCLGGEVQLIKKGWQSDNAGGAIGERTWLNVMKKDSKPIKLLALNATISPSRPWPWPKIDPLQVCDKAQYKPDFLARLKREGIFVSLSEVETPLAIVFSSEVFSRKEFEELASCIRPVAPQFISETHSCALYYPLQSDVGN